MPLLPMSATTGHAPGSKESPPPVRMLNGTARRRAIAPTTEAATKSVADEQLLLGQFPHDQRM